MDLFGSCLGWVVGISVRPSTAAPRLPAARTSVQPGADSRSIARRLPGYHESRGLRSQPGYAYTRCNSDIQRHLGHNDIGMASACSQSVVERFYNLRRRHLILGGINPMEYETRARFAVTVSNQWRPLLNYCCLILIVRAHYVQSINCIDT